MKHKVNRYVTKLLGNYFRKNGDKDMNSISELLEGTIDRTAEAVLEDVGRLRIPIGRFEGHFVHDLQGYKEVRERWTPKPRPYKR